MYKASRVVKSTKALKLGLRNENRQVLQTLTPEGEAGDKQGSGLEKPRPWSLAVSTSPDSSLGTAGRKLSDLISSKDGRNVDFLMYKYQKLHFWISELEFRWWFSMKKWGWTGEDGREILGRILYHNLDWWHGGILFMNISRTHTLWSVPFLSDKKVKRNKQNHFKIGILKR